MNLVYGLLGCFIYLSMPVIARLSHWGYIDLGITFYTTASLLCLLRWREERNQLRWLALTGISLGFALATKPNGLVAALLICSMFLLVVAKPPRKRLGAMGGELLLFGSLTLLPFLPWLVKIGFRPAIHFTRYWAAGSPSARGRKAAAQVTVRWAYSQKGNYSMAKISGSFSACLCAYFFPGRTTIRNCSTAC